MNNACVAIVGGRVNLSEDMHDGSSLLCIDAGVTFAFMQ